MTKVSKEEVLRVAKISNISLRDEEIQPLINRMEQVLSYAQRVAEVAVEVEEPSTKNSNVFRKDLVVPQDPEVILLQAPERADSFFVVPMILDN